MTEGRTSTTGNVMRTHRQVMHWMLFFSNLFLLILTVGGWLLWYALQYTGGWYALMHTTFRQFYLSSQRAPFRLILSCAAEGLAPATLDVTQQAALLVTLLAVFFLLQGLVRMIAAAVWRSSSRRHLQQVSALAQEAKRLTEQERNRAALTPKVDLLEEAIDHISPTQTARLHMNDPDLQGLEEAINDLLDRMQAAYSQQSRFVSDASHELRTPIAVLKGYADLLERWGKDDPQVREEAVAAIQAEAERMNRLVEQLLFLARGDSGRTRLQIKPLDLTEVAKEVWEESQMIDAGHHWRLDAPQPVPCQGDRDMIKQALRILTDNAAKYTPAGKTITVRSHINENGRACLSVRDEGMGISAEDAAHVFDRFYRSDPARTRQSGGAGLGLAIADWIVTQHEGHLEVYSWEGVGSRFSIVL